MIDTNAPDGAVARIDGLYYKIGLHGKAFFHNSREWIASSRPAYEIKKAATVQKSQPKADHNCREVLEYIKVTIADQAMTVNQIAKEIDRQPKMVRDVVRYWRKRGVIIKAGKHRCPITKRVSVVWRINPNDSV